MNATFDVEAAEIRVHEAVHLGIGTATERGLLVTVVRDADRRTTLELAREMRRLGDRARDGSIPPAELTGSTFTISNCGALALDEGYPVINHPEVAILGVGAIRMRAVVIGDAVVARPTVHLSCCFDHRVGDGADAGALLSRLQELVEQPERMMLNSLLDP